MTLEKYLHDTGMIVQNDTGETVYMYWENLSVGSASADHVRMNPHPQFFVPHVQSLINAYLH